MIQLLTRLIFCVCIDSIPFPREITDLAPPMAQNNAAQSLSMKSISRNMAVPHSRTSGRARRTTACSVRTASLRIGVNFPLRRKQAGPAVISTSTRPAPAHNAGLRQSAGTCAAEAGPAPTLPTAFRASPSRPTASGSDTGCQT